MKNKNLNKMIIMLKKKGMVRQMTRKMILGMDQIEIMNNDDLML